MTAPLYELRSATRYFELGNSTIKAVDDIDVSIDKDELIALEGPSGSGKTTLLQLLGALDRPTSGEVLFEGRNLAGLSDGELADLRLRSFGFIFQQFNLLPTLTAVQNVEAGHAPLGLPQKELEERSLMMLSEVGLRERAFHLPSQMSGGEQQRVAIARALLAGPRVVLADEPTGNLDSQSGADVITLLTDLAARHGTTIIVATHDAGLAARAPRRLSMHDGHLVGDVKNGKKVKTTKKS
jgi:putative ABC transport system ATP-binding protein